MRIKNKYLRNRAFRTKYWNRIRAKSHPYETMMPYNWHFGPLYYEHLGQDTEDQIKRHFEWITEQARALENGSHYGMFHATARFRRTIDREKKAKVRVAMQKIRSGDYDIEIPQFKKDADWLYF